MQRYVLPNNLLWALGFPLDITVRTGDDSILPPDKKDHVIF